MHDRGDMQGRCLKPHDAGAGAHARACKRLAALLSSAEASALAPVLIRRIRAASACVFMLTSKFQIACSCSRSRVQRAYAHYTSDIATA
jgi:hypothetical protein